MVAWSASDTRSRGICLLSPDKALDAHHSVTYKFGGDVVAHHNTLCYVISDFCK